MIRHQRCGHFWRAIHCRCPIETTSQTLNCRRFEQSPKRQFNAHFYSNAIHQSNRLQGVAAKLEEIVADSDLWLPQDVGPYRDEPLLRSRLRFNRSDTAVSLGRSTG